MMENKCFVWIANESQNLARFTYCPDVFSKHSVMHAFLCYRNADDHTFNRAKLSLEKVN